MTTGKCPTCGSTLHVETSKEGTSFLHPLDVALIEELKVELYKSERERWMLRLRLERLEKIESTHKEAK